MEADYGLANNADVRLTYAGLLVQPRVGEQIPVILFTYTIEVLHCMIASELFDPPGTAHRSGPASKKPGSFSKRSKRGSGRGGASSAARNAFH